VKIVEVLHQSYPNDFKFLASHFDLLCGTDSVRLAIEQHKDLADLQKQWQTDNEAYRDLCKPILLYE
jgi:uncharacterized protein YbbC (DUF1343 family)